MTAPQRLGQEMIERGDDAYEKHAIARVISVRHDAGAQTRVSQRGLARNTYRMPMKMPSSKISACLPDDKTMSGCLIGALDSLGADAGYDTRA